MNWTILRLKSYIESIHFGITLKQNRLTIFSHLLSKNLKWFLLLLQKWKMLLLVDLYFQ